MSANRRPAALGFKVARLRRKLGQRIRRRLLADDGRELPSMFVSGAARSGTTWLAEVLAEATGSRLLFEPLAPQAIPSGLDVPVFPYLRPEDDRPDLEAHLRRLLSGRIRDPWIDKQPVTRRPRGRLLKSVRAAYMLGWLARRFPGVVIVFVTRDPWSVVRSRIDVGWDPAPDLDAILGQERLLETLGPLARHLRDARAALGAPPNGGIEMEAIVAANAVLWAVSNRMAHRDLESTSAIRVGYETLRGDPTGEFGRLIDAVASRGAFDTSRAARALAAVERPSMTSHSATFASGREGFERRFGPRAASIVGDAAARFGLEATSGGEWRLRP